MARRYDPRYDVNQGYAAGDAMVQLAQLLRQGVGDYQRQQTIDEESGRRDQDYLLRLQQFMGQQEEQGLDRQLKERQIAGMEEQRAEQGRLRDEAAAIKKLGLTGRTKLMGTDPDVEEAMPPPPDFAADPERLQPNILQSLVKRPRTMQEMTKASGATPEEMGHPDFMTLLKDLVKAPKEPKAPNISTRNPEHDIVVDGKVTERGVARPVEAKPADLDSYTESALASMGKTKANATPQEIEKATGIAEKRRSREQAAGAEAGAAARLPYEVYERRLKEYEAIDQTTASAATTIKQLDALSKKISVPGATQRATGYLGRELGSATQSNPDATMFDSKAGALAPLVRAMGDKGNLSDNDIKRGLDLIPNKHDIDTVKRQKLTDLRDWFEGARDAAAKRLRSPAGSPSNPAVTTTPDDQANAYLKKHGY